MPDNAPTPTATSNTNILSGFLTSFGTFNDFARYLIRVAENTLGKGNGSQKQQLVKQGLVLALQFAEVSTKNPLLDILIESLINALVDSMKQTGELPGLPTTAAGASSPSPSPSPMRGASPMKDAEAAFNDSPRESVPAVYAASRALPFPPDDSLRSAGFKEGDVVMRSVSGTSWLVMPSETSRSDYPSLYTVDHVIT